MPKGRDGIGNCVVETTVENAKLDWGNFRILFAG
jgi:hypothetical protein